MFRTCVIVTMAVLAATATATAQPSIGKPFDLKVGESVTVGSQALIVGFGEMLNDGRCPLSLYCFWEGDATAQMWTNLPGESPQTFQLHTHRGLKWKFQYGAYDITLTRISPYPVDQEPIPDGIYVATVQVDGGPAPAEISTWGRIKALYRP